MSCTAEPVLTYKGLISTADDLRHMAGLPSKDPLDPSYITDAELNIVIARYKAMLDAEASRRNDLQCQEYEVKLQAAEASTAGAMEEILASEIMPNGAQDYADEVPVSVQPSGTSVKTGTGKPLISYGIIEEPYLSVPIAVTIVDTVGDKRHAATMDHEFEKAATTSPFERWRYGTRGRRVYVTNNQRNIATIYVWLITRDRLEDFVRDTNPDHRALLDYRLLENDDLVSDIMPDFNARMIAEVRTAVGMGLEVGTRMENVKDS